MTMGIRKTLVNRTERLQSLGHFHIDSLKENLEGDLSRKKKKVLMVFLAKGKGVSD